MDGRDGAWPMWAEMGPGDWAGRNVDELSPQSLPQFHG
jgi:hypothetical protein